MPSKAAPERSDCRLTGTETPNQVTCSGRSLKRPALYHAISAGDSDGNSWNPPVFDPNDFLYPTRMLVPVETTQTDYITTV